MMQPIKENEYNKQKTDYFILENELKNKDITKKNVAIQSFRLANKLYLQAKYDVNACKTPIEIDTDNKDVDDLLEKQLTMHQNLLQDVCKSFNRYRRRCQETEREIKAIKEAIEAGCQKVIAIKREDSPSLPQIKQTIEDFTKLDKSILIK